MSQPAKQIFPDFSRSLLNTVFNAYTFGHRKTGIPPSGGSGRAGDNEKLKRPTLRLNAKQT